MYIQPAIKMLETYIDHNSGEETLFKIQFSNTESLHMIQE